ncbi:MAG: bifunctional riboflavin kinase/FAD synthetase [Cellvibrionaceae bacterium]
MKTSKREFIRGLHNLRSEHHGNVVTIGSFDGVHLGHQAILKQVLGQSGRLQLPSVAMIFEPQPHEFFAGDKAPPRLMRLGEKVQALFGEGIHRVFCLPFNASLSELSASDFIERVLVEGLGAKYLVIGDDFRFGAGRTGDYAQLVEAGRQHGFTVTDTQSFLIEQERVSSTRIRELLQLGQFEEASCLLGKAYTISGRVVKGNQLGRELGTPTANVHLHRYRSPLSGVFAVVTTLSSGALIEGVANVGVRPTLIAEGHAPIPKPILEVHLFDWQGDLYDQQIKVEFKCKLRDEKKFNGLAELQQQIAIDVQQAHDFFHHNS